MRPLFILRPEPGNTTTAARAAARGLDVRPMPLFQAVSIRWEPPPADRFDALLLTSAATVRLAGPDLAAYRGLPVYAVGAKSADAAREAGFAVAHVGTRGVATLIPILAAAGHARVLHPGGVETQPVDSGPLCIRHVSVYQAEPVDLDLSDASAALRGGVILVHSPRAGARLAELVPIAARAGIDIVAISDAAALAAGVGWRSVAAAPTPDDEAMLALAADLCEG